MPILGLLGPRRKGILSRLNGKHNFCPDTTVSIIKLELFPDRSIDTHKEKFTFHRVLEEESVVIRIVVISMLQHHGRTNH